MDEINGLNKDSLPLAAEVVLNGLLLVVVNVSPRPDSIGSHQSDVDVNGDACGVDEKSYLGVLLAGVSPQHGDEED